MPTVTLSLSVYLSFYFPENIVNLCLYITHAKNVSEYSLIKHTGDHSIFSMVTFRLKNDPYTYTVNEKTVGYSKTQINFLEMLYLAAPQYIARSL